MSPTVPLAAWIPANAPRKTVDGGPSALASGTRMGDLDGTPGSWFWSGPTLVFASIWEVNLQMEVFSFIFLSLFHSLPPPLSVTAFPINKINLKTKQENTQDFDNLTSTAFQWQHRGGDLKPINSKSLSSHS